MYQSVTCVMLRCLRTLIWTIEYLCNTASFSEAISRVKVCGDVRNSNNTDNNCAGNVILCLVFFKKFRTSIWKSNETCSLDLLRKYVWHTITQSHICAVSAARHLICLTKQVCLQHSFVSDSSGLRISSDSEFHTNRTRDTEISWPNRPVLQCAIHTFLGGGKKILWRGGNFFCAVMPKAPYWHPIEVNSCTKCTKAWYACTYIEHWIIETIKKKICGNLGGGATAPPAPPPQLAPLLYWFDKGTVKSHTLLSTNDFKKSC